ncbi:MaoC family dehydratase [Aquabacterium sp.]|uniref:MaoC family dehydratase n=1 Tax=Aquabacterium sp. TaxID=1872578 RepID=UPI002E341570|nr:MaoC/PaaZ C-terminal domain-containing protein [Aquabacterium sp.]HEX5311375.1 MaoC/PaaZ C-terminal domain-containing protein [Aquabacterium sp.]
MKTIEINKLPGQVALNLGALRASSKRPGRVEALPQVTYVRPKVLVDARAVAAYAKVCGFKQAHGVPLLFPHMLAFPLSMMLFGSKYYPWPAMGTVHLANQASQFERIDVGDELRIELQTGELLAHEKGQIFTLHSRAIRRDTLVWESSGHFLRMGVADVSGTPFESDLIDPAPLSHQADFYAGAGIGRRYARVSGDVNPIHLSALTARILGFKRAIAHGMWTTARALSTLMPREPAEQASVVAEFKTPLYLPARTSLWTNRTDASTLFEVRNAKGDKPHLRGRVTY